MLALGLGNAGLPAALRAASRRPPARLQQGTQAPAKVTKEMLIAAETMIGLEAATDFHRKHRAMFS